MAEAMTIPEIEAEQATIERELTRLHHEREDLARKHARISEDLDLGYDSYRYTVGGDRKSYEQWRRRAFKVRAGTEKKWQKIRDQEKELRDRRVVVQNLLIVHRAGLRQASTEELLRAMLGILEQSDTTRWSQQDKDLIVAAKLHVGWSVP